MSRRLLFLWMAVTALAPALLLPAAAAAYDFRLTPSVGVREEYNSNLFFTTDGEEDDWLTTIAPGLEMTWRTERLDAGLSGNLYRRLYNDRSDLDETDYGVRGRLAWKLTPEFSFSANGEFRRESRPDRHIEEAGQVDLSWDYRYLANALAEWAVTDLTNITASYGYDKLDYPDVFQRDGETHSVGIGLVHDLSWFTTLTQARLNFGYSDSSYETIDIKNYVLTVGVFRSVHELWSIMVNAGVMHARSEFDDFFGGTSKNSHNGWSGDASLIYKGERTDASFNFFHGLAPAYGYNGSTLRTSAVLDSAWRFIYDLSATLSAGWYLNKSDAGQFSTQDIDERTWRVRPGLLWKPNKYFALDVAYQYTQVDYRLTDRTANQQLVYAGVKLSYPLFDE